MGGQVADEWEQRAGGVTADGVTAEFTGFGVSAGVPVNGRVYALRNGLSRMMLGAASGVAIQYPGVAPYPAADCAGGGLAAEGSGWSVSGGECGEWEVPGGGGRMARRC